MIAEPHRVEPDVLGRLRHTDELGERNLPLDLGKLYTDEQRSSHGGRLGDGRARQAERNEPDAYDIDRYMRQIVDDRMENR